MENNVIDINADDPVVFLVDDDEGGLESLQYLVRSMGYRSLTFSSPEDFCDQFNPAIPGCIVMDVRMPGMSGLELQAELQSRTYCPPIIFVTGFGDIPTSVSAIKAGAVDFLEKPINDEHFQSCLEEAIAADARERQQRAVSDQRKQSLTNRQLEIMDLIVEGKSLKEISAACNISIQTAAKHRAHIFEKLDVENNVELVRLVLQS